MFMSLEVTIIIMLDINNNEFTRIQFIENRIKLFHLPHFFFMLQQRESTLYRRLHCFSCTVILKPETGIQNKSIWDGLSKHLVLTEFA